MRPKFRGRGLAGRLLRRAVEDAAGIGYTDMVLDTFPFLETAIGLYRRHGFVTVPPYNDNPTPGLVYMRLHLADFC